VTTRGRRRWCGHRSDHRHRHPAGRRVGRRGHDPRVGQAGRRRRRGRRDRRGDLDRQGRHGAARAPPPAPSPRSLARRARRSRSARSSPACRPAPARRRPPPRWKATAAPRPRERGERSRKDVGSAGERCPDHAGRRARRRRRGRRRLPRVGHRFPTGASPRTTSSRSAQRRRVGQRRQGPGGQAGRRPVIKGGAATLARYMDEEPVDPDGDLVPPRSPSRRWTAGARSSRRPARRSRSPT
jgi:hypothetical protein